MKQFRKNEQSFFVCEECGETFKRCVYLSIHIGKYHNRRKYFDKWIKDENDGKCEICGNKTQFSNFGDGYKKCCSKECTTKLRKKTCLEKYGKESISQIDEIKKKKEETCLKNYGVKSGWNTEKTKKTKLEKYGDEYYINREKAKKTCLKKYGVEHPLQNKEIHRKFENTCLQKYGVKNPWQSEEKKNLIKESNLTNNGVEYPMQSKEIQEKSKQIILKKYGVENVFQNESIKEKSKQTCLRNYGVEYAQQSKEIKEKGKKTCQEKYGVDHPNQNKEQYEKVQKSACKLKRFRDTDIFYQGEYEHDFLIKYYDLFPGITRGPSIKYIFNDKNKIYYSDFYIKILNLLIEIKSSWVYNENIDSLKKEAVITEGYNYIMIIDKDYKEFNQLINKCKT